MVKREEVYKAIDEERNYQNDLNSRIIPIAGEILLLEEYIDRARHEWVVDFNQPEQKALENIRKIAGICVRCLENHGVPLREKKSK